MTKRMIAAIAVVMIIAFPSTINAQCSACVIDTTVCPVTGDAVLCADTLANGSAGLNYEENVTFTMTKRYVVKQGDNLPGTNFNVDDLINFGFPLTLPLILPVEEVTLSNVSNLPAGVDWECDMMANNCVYYPDSVSRYGCVKLCGIPDCDSAGNYNVTFDFSYSIDMQQVIDAFLMGAPFPIPIPTTVPTPESLSLSMVVTSVSPGPLTITANKPTTISQGESITLASTPGYTTYTWSSGQTDSTITVSPNQSTIYSLEVTDVNGCSRTETIDITVLISSGISDLSGTSLNIYPNPSNGIFRVETGLSEQEIKFQIFNLEGKMVYDQAHYNQEVSLDLSNLDKGVYYLHATNEKVNGHSKIVIQ